MRPVSLLAAFGVAVTLAVTSLPATAQTPPAESAGPVVAGSVEDELGRSLAAVLLGTDSAARDAFALERTGPRFAQMLGGPEGVTRAYTEMAGSVSGATLQDVVAGPNGSVLILFTGSDGQEIKVHVLRGVNTPDGRLKVGGFALVP